MAKHLDSDEEPIKPNGGLIRSLRYERGWTQQILAKNSKVSKKTIENMESGQTARPQTLKGVAQALGVSIDRLLSLPTGDPRPQESLADISKKIKEIEYRLESFELYNRAEELRIARRLREAEFFYKEALQRTPKGQNAQLARIGLAKIYRRRNDWKRAIGMLDVVLAENPKNARAHYNRACYFHLSGQSKERVLDELKRACELSDYYGEYALQDEDFESIRTDPEFRRTILAPGLPSHTGQ